MDKPIEPLTEIAVGQFITDLQQVIVVVTGLAMLLVQLHHGVIQARGAAAEPSNFGVQQQSRHGSASVVADRRVGTIFVGTVEVDPSVERRFGQALHEIARPSLHGSNLTGEVLQPLFRGPQSGSNQQQALVIRGQAFRDPQFASVNLILIIVGLEGLGPEPSHVPGVEELVAAKRQPTSITLRSDHGPATCHEQGRVVMLQSTAAPEDHVEEIILGVGHVAPESLLGRNHLSQILRGLLAIPEGIVTQIDEVMVDTRDLERENLAGPAEDRAVHQLIEMRCQESVGSCWISGQWADAPRPSRR